MKKLLAVFLTLAMLLSIMPAVAESAIDTSEHVKIVYLVTGDKPTNRTDEVLAKINELLTEKINAELEFRWIEWTDWQTQYNLALATQSGPESCATRLNGSLAHPSGEWTVNVCISEMPSLSSSLAECRNRGDYHPNESLMRFLEKG
jgi:hypothetical protein